MGRRLLDQRRSTHRAQRWAAGRDSTSGREQGLDACACDRAGVDHRRQRRYYALRFGVRARSARTVALVVVVVCRQHACVIVQCQQELGGGAAKCGGALVERNCAVKVGGNIVVAVVGHAEVEARIRIVGVRRSVHPIEANLEDVCPADEGCLWEHCALVHVGATVFAGPPHQEIAQVNHRADMAKLGGPL